MTLRAATLRRAVHAAVAALDPAADADAGEGEALTIDDLAARSGVPSRTVRFYQTQGVLPGPRRRGRIALYGAAHVERLRLIGTLQGRGLRLSAIRDVVRRGRPETLSLSHWLGLEERLRTRWVEDEPRRVTAEQLRSLVGTRSRTAIARLLRLDLVRRDGRGYVVPSPQLLGVIVALGEAGVSLDTAGEAGAILRRTLSAAADELVSHFAERAGRGFGSLATPDELARAFDALRPLGVDAVRIIFSLEMERAIAALVGTRQVDGTAVAQGSGLRRSRRRVSRHTP